MAGTPAWFYSLFVRKLSKHIRWMACLLATMTPVAKLHAADILVTTNADSVQTIQAGFVGVSGPNFKIDGVNAGRDFGLFGAGLQLNVGRFGSVFGGYDLQANGWQDYHTGSAGRQLGW